MLPYLLDVPTLDVLRQRAARGGGGEIGRRDHVLGLLPRSITNQEASNGTLLSCSSGDQKCDIDVLAGLTPFGGSEDNPSPWPSSGDSHPGHPLASTYIHHSYPCPQGHMGFFPVSPHYVFPLCLCVYPHFLLPQGYPLSEEGPPDSCVTLPQFDDICKDLISK